MTTRTGGLIFVALFLLLLAAPTLAADWQGHWVMRSGSTALFDYFVQPAPDGWKVEWRRPTSFQMSPDRIEKLAGPVKTLVTTDVSEAADTLVMRFVDKDAKPLPALILERTKTGGAELRFQGVSLGPFPVARESSSPALGPWDTAKSYAVQRHFPTSSEMTAIFDADQAARRQPELIDWRKLRPDDSARRVRTVALLDSGALRSGDDFYHAAFVLQHGNEPRDYLLAHLLAMAAMARGRSDAAWIASATLDRYLQASGAKQVTGTQYRRDKQGRWTMEPYDRSLVPDPLREALGVPRIADQEKWLLDDAGPLPR